MLRDSLKSSRVLRRAVPLLARWTPDVPVTRDLPHLGTFTFGLRRHRWMLGPDPMEFHLDLLAGYGRLIDEGATVYDIGANIGYYACYIARHFAAREVLAFEPMTANLKLLRRNAARTGGKVRVLPVAVADVDARELLQVDDVSDGSAVLDRISDGRAAETREALGLGAKTEEVEVRTLDRLIRDMDLPAPGFIKIDTEGAEAVVLRGAQQTLDRHGPHLAIALHGPDKAAEVYERLTPLGYAIFGYADATAKQGWEQLSATSIQTAHNNVFASRDAERLRQPFASPS